VKRLAVLISGSGTNLQAILDAVDAGRLAGAEVAVVVSNRKAAYGLERARRHGIPTLYHPLQPYRAAGRPRSDYDRDLVALLEPYRIDLVVMAGWMHLFTMAFLGPYSGRVINLHPALPGTFPGMHGIAEALAAYQRGEIEHTGVMVHYVPDEGVDVGPPILVREVPILPNDTLDDLEQRVHTTEHALYVEAIAKALDLPRNSCK
jgi:formyltetrahydrofolate-dependent phosphoribosylglycinamide formyltransferase